MNRNDIVIDENYLQHIRSLACLVPLCRKTDRVDPHHLKAVGWRKAKRNDYTAIPLCRFHHSEVEQIGAEKFCGKYSIEDLWQDAFFILVEYIADSMVTQGANRCYQIERGA